MAVSRTKQYVAGGGTAALRDVKRSPERRSSLKKPTIRVVAAKAGVAISTVSRYLNDDSVSPRMKARLSQVIESLGYKPSQTARNLSLGFKGCIGVVVDSIQDPWFTQLLTGMEEELQSRDTSLMLLSLELRDKYDPAIAFEWIDERRVDGLIIAKCHRHDKALVQAAMDAQLPIVAVAPDETLRDVSVLRADNIGAGRMLGAHLAELGHRWVAFAGGPHASVESRHRLQGLREELGKRGVQMRDEDVCFRASYEADEGAAFAQTFLLRPTRPTAVVLGNDASGDRLHSGGSAARGSRPRRSVGGWIRRHSRRRVVVAGPDDDGAADAGDGTRRLPSPVPRDCRGRGADERGVRDDARRAREHGRAANRTANRTSLTTCFSWWYNAPGLLEPVPERR